MIYHKLFLLSSLSLFLYSADELGCNAILDTEPKGCSVDNILSNPSSSILNTKDNLSLIVKQENINITKNLLFVKVLHNEYETLIQRRPTKEVHSCPPFCIEPLFIEGVQTVAELETLEFIEKLKEKKARLLIDVRSNKAYKKETIPGSISLPLHMIQDKSPYQEKVLKLLGAKKLVTKNRNSKWYFPNAQFLLIFGQSATNNEASNFVKKLLELGYPEAKILYNRGGLESWKQMGLSVI
jgi:rhodanese-related sulfurtransferase